MSGQMTNGEIEDVLASIRRLLRDDGTPDASEGSARPRARRLVLNPDSMVLGNSTATSPRAEVLVLTNPQPDTGLVNLEQDHSRIDDAGDAEPSWNGPLVLSDPVVLPRQPFADGTATNPGPRSSVQHGPAGASIDPTDASFGKQRPDKPTSLEERIAELEAALAREEAEWEADGGDPEVFASVRHLPSGEGLGGAKDVAADVAEAPEAPALSLAGSTDPVPSVAAEEAELFDDPGVLAPPRPRMSEDEVRAWIEAEALSAFGTTLDDLVGEAAVGVADIAAGPFETASDVTVGMVADPEAGLAEAADIPTPDLVVAPGAGAFDADADADIAWPVPSPDRQDPVDDCAAGASGPEAGPAWPRQGAVDPAVVAEVRRIVSDVIRDELRGSLGEQLTRSIRRLIRRELAQAKGPTESK